MDFLDLAVDEGSYLYLSPTNEQEEHEFLVIKVIQEMTDAVIELEMERDQVDLKLRKMTIRHTATRALVAAQELDPDELPGLDDAELCVKNDISELAYRIENQEKVIEYLRASIQTEKYKNVDHSMMQHIHFD